MTPSPLLGMLVGGRDYNTNLLTRLFIPLLIVASVTYFFTPRRRLKKCRALLCVAWVLWIAIGGFDLSLHYTVNRISYDHAPFADLALWFVGGLTLIFAALAVR